MNSQSSISPLLIRTCIRRGATKSRRLQVFLPLRWLVVIFPGLPATTQAQGLITASRTISLGEQMPFHIASLGNVFKAIFSNKSNAKVGFTRV